MSIIKHSETGIPNQSKQSGLFFFESEHHILVGVTDDLKTSMTTYQNKLKNQTGKFRQLNIKECQSIYHVKVTDFKDALQKYQDVLAQSSDKEFISI